MEEMEDAFNFMDQDKDGHVTFQEFKKSISRTKWWIFYSLKKFLGGIFCVRYFFCMMCLEFLRISLITITMNLNVSAD